MNKSGLVDALQRESGLSKAKTEAVIEVFIGSMSHALAKGDRIEVRGFCSFFVKSYKGYGGRNPKTGASVEIPPKRLPFFKCGKELKERIDW